MKNNTKIINKAIYDLFKTEAYMGAILQEIDFSIKPEIPTAGIWYNKHVKKFQIAINLYFFEKLKSKQRIAVLKHEILHFLNSHLHRMEIIQKDGIKDTAPVDVKVRNVAADMAINQYIVNLPDGCVNVSDWKLDSGEYFPKFKTYEEYYRLIKDNKKNNEEISNKYGKDGTSTDIHDWEELSAEEKEQMLNELKNVFKRTMDKNQLHKSTLESKLNDIIKETDTQLEKFNARRILSNCIRKFASSSDRVNSWKRVNKRLGELAPGSMNDKLPRLNIYIDTSGSRSYKELNMDLDIVKSFLKVGARTCILGFWHTNLYRIKKFKITNSLLKEDIESGGTCINEVIQDINKKRPDLSIILTDGAYDWDNILPKTETIVILVGNSIDTKHPMHNKLKTLQIKNLV